MSSRDIILQRLRAELADEREPEEPMPVEVWPSENLAPEALAERFVAELAAVDGETIRCPSIADARRRLAELARSADWQSLGAMDRTIVRDAAGELPPDAIHWSAAGQQPRQIAELSASLVEADHLLADTGSCLISCPTTQDRLFCYLPPACVVVARSEQLSEHLQDAWPSVVARASDPKLTGEFVIVTGPSRTADIEKTLILGVHGPKRLIVLLVD